MTPSRQSNILNRPTKSINSKKRPIIDDLIIQSDTGMQHLIGSNFQLGGDASAAAGPVGRHASADTDWKLNVEMLTYSRAKGAFAGLTLNGAKISRDDDSMHAIYGGHVSTRDALTGRAPIPAAAEPFLAAVREAKAQARASGLAEK
jgi:lipid-binding SYLF domain-containing protein